MRKPRVTAFVACAVAALACSSGESAVTDSVSTPVLDFRKATIRLVTAKDTLRLVVELASTKEQQTLGLMERSALPDTAGMLFVYPAMQPADAGFWMFRTRIPLDIAFADSSGAIRAIRQMVPCEATIPQGCPTYAPGVPYRTALEVSSGYFARHGVALGDRLVLADTVRP